MRHKPAFWGSAQIERSVPDWVRENPRGADNLGASTFGSQQPVAGEVELVGTEVLPIRVTE
jgi:hypothetical protein